MDAWSGGWCGGRSGWTGGTIAVHVLLYVENLEGWTKQEGIETVVTEGMDELFSISPGEKD